MNDDGLHRKMNLQIRPIKRGEYPLAHAFFNASIWMKKALKILFLESLKILTCTSRRLMMLN